jgi:hypothetical protein
MAKSNGIFKRGSSQYLRVVLPKTRQLKRAEILKANEPTVLTKNKSTPTTCSPSAYYLRDIYEYWEKSKPRSSDAIWFLNFVKSANTRGTPCGKTCSIL